MATSKMRYLLFGPLDALGPQTLPQYLTAQPAPAQDFHGGYDRPIGIYQSLDW